MIALLLASWLYLLAHAGIGSALADDPAECSTDTECGCDLDCLDGVETEEDAS